MEGPGEADMRVSLEEDARALVDVHVSTATELFEVCRLEWAGLGVHLGDDSHLLERSRKRTSALLVDPYPHTHALRPALVSTMARLGVAVPRGKIVAMWPWDASAPCVGCMHELVEYAGEGTTLLKVLQEACKVRHELLFQYLDRPLGHENHPMDILYFPGTRKGVGVASTICNHLAADQSREGGSKISWLVTSTFLASIYLSWFLLPLRLNIKGCRLVLGDLRIVQLVLFPFLEHLQTNLVPLNVDMAHPLSRLRLTWRELRPMLAHALPIKDRGLPLEPAAAVALALSGQLQDLQQWAAVGCVDRDREWVTRLQVKDVYTNVFFRTPQPLSVHGKDLGICQWQVVCKALYGQYAARGGFESGVLHKFVHGMREVMYAVDAYKRAMGGWKYGVVMAHPETVLQTLVVCAFPEIGRGLKVLNVWDGIGISVLQSQAVEATSQDDALLLYQRNLSGGPLSLGIIVKKLTWVFAAALGIRATDSIPALVSTDGHLLPEFEEVQKQAFDMAHAFTAANAFYALGDACEQSPVAVHFVYLVQGGYFASVERAPKALVLERKVFMEPKPAPPDQPFVFRYTPEFSALAGVACPKTTVQPQDVLDMFTRAWRDNETHQVLACAAALMHADIREMWEISFVNSDVAKTMVNLVMWRLSSDAPSRHRAKFAGSMQESWLRSPEAAIWWFILDVVREGAEHRIVRAMMCLAAGNQQWSTLILWSTIVRLLPPGPPPSAFSVGEFVSNAKVHCNGTMPSSSYPKPGKKAMASPSMQCLAFDGKVPLFSPIYMDEDARLEYGATSFEHLFRIGQLYHHVFCARGTISFNVAHSKDFWTACLFRVLFRAMWRTFGSEKDTSAAECAEHLCADYWAMHGDRAYHDADEAVHSRVCQRKLTGHVDDEVQAVDPLDTVNVVLPLIDNETGTVCVDQCSLLSELRVGVAQCVRETYGVSPQNALVTLNFIHPVTLVQQRMAEGASRVL